MSLYLGIDPGLSGALALVCPRRGVLEVVGVPVCSNGTHGVVTREVDVRETGELLRFWSDRHGLAIQLEQHRVAGHVDACGRLAMPRVARIVDAVPGFP